MAILYESDEKIQRLLEKSVDFDGKRVIDIGCGDGMLALSIAARTEKTVGIDPDLEDIKLARQNSPATLIDRVEFFDTSIEEFKPKTASPFDVALYLWSL
jgi:2-polyprenyl-6-hydroxyphenyl methylase/3-demethylubiquinone-9 3-methyltransferase